MTILPIWSLVAISVSALAIAFADEFLHDLPGWMWFYVLSAYLAPPLHHVSALFAKEEKRREEHGPTAGLSVFECGDATQIVLPHGHGLLGRSGYTLLVCIALLIGTVQVLLVGQTTFWLWLSTIPLGLALTLRVIPRRAELRLEGYQLDIIRVLGRRTSTTTLSRDQITTVEGALYLPSISITTLTGRSERIFNPDLTLQNRKWLERTLAEWLAQPQ